MKESADYKYLKNLFLNQEYSDLKISVLDFNLKKTENLENIQCGNLKNIISIDIENIIKYIQNRYTPKIIYWIIYELIVISKYPNRYYLYAWNESSRYNTYSYEYNENILNRFTNLKFDTTYKLISKYPYLFKDINPKVEDYDKLEELYGFLTI